jgi:hypothetical protein
LKQDFNLSLCLRGPSQPLGNSTDFLCRKLNRRIRARALRYGARLSPAYSPGSLLQRTCVYFHFQEQS